MQYLIFNHAAIFITFVKSPPSRTRIYHYLLFLTHILTYCESIRFCIFDCNIRKCLSSLKYVPRLYKILEYILECDLKFYKISQKLFLKYHKTAKNLYRYN